jgi:hypothetical protein
LLEFFEDENQTKFNQIMNDERNEESGWIKKFIKDIDKFGIDKVPTNEIFNYFEIFEKRCCQLHTIKNEKEIAALSKYTNRLFMDYLYHKFIDTEDCVNDIFMFNCLKLSKLSLLEIGVDRKYVVEDTPNQYSDAIDLFSFLKFVTNPNDLIDLIFFSCKLILNESLSYMKSKNEKINPISADDFFPILIYVIVHSDLVFLNYIIGFIVTFYNQNDSEKIYYLTQVESFFFNLFFSCC